MLAIVFDSVGFGEWFVLLAVVLVVVGPKKLPSAARTIGNYYARFRRAADGFKRQLMDMETEFNKAAEAAERSVDGAFRSMGDESKAVPGAGVPEAASSDDGRDAYGDAYPAPADAAPQDVASSAPEADTESAPSAAASAGDAAGETTDGTDAGDSATERTEARA